MLVTQDPEQTSTYKAARRPVEDNPLTTSC
jgi:hypothetical protein